MLGNRKVIFKCVTGSHLYGTNLPTSDDDYTGVFLPSTEDLLGLKHMPKEITDNIKITDSVRNAKGDVDCKYLSLPHFLRLAMEGQSIAIELFFVPEDKILEATPEWHTLTANKEHIFSRKGIAPFIGFAMAQANKSEIKGLNLAKIRGLIAILRTELEKHGSTTRLLCDVFDDVTMTDINIKGIRVNKRLADDRKTDVIEIAGRCFNLNIRLKMFVLALEKMESRYGSRSENAAKEGIDYKSLCHAYRLVSEAQEFLLYQTITLPRPDANFLKSIRQGEYQTNFRDEINNKIAYIKEEIEPKSTLRQKTGFNQVNKLCMEILAEHIKS